jgi:periplasmic protein TonB
VTPSAVATVPVRQATRPQLTGPVPRLVPPGPRSEVERESARTRTFLNDSLLENHRFKSSSKKLDLLVALLLHFVAIGGPLLAGLYYTDTINLKQFAMTMLVAPPPPPPPPPAPSVVRAQAPKRVFMNAGQLIAPTIIPRQVAELKEAPLEPDNLGGIGGVPGGVPGGQMGGVVGGVLGGIPSTAAKPPAPTVGKPGPLRVGGRVRPPKAIEQMQPLYPVLARQAHVQGEVQIDAILDAQGNVVDMKVISGPPLLYQAALDALRKWKYEPTYLNEEPIAVQMIVTITFRLGQ